MATSAREFHSDLAVPPGEYLAEVLDDLGMSQADLSRRMGRPIQAINEIVKGSKEIVPDTALQLERVVAVPAHIWLSLEKEYRLVQARQHEEARLLEEAELVSPEVYRAMAREGWVESVRSRTEKVRELWRFFGVASLKNVANVGTGATAFRIGVPSKANPYALAAWLRRGELLAGELETSDFDAKKLRRTAEELRSYTFESDLRTWFLPARDLLAACGVALVFVKRLPKTYAHGATHWLSSSKVVVQLSDRYKWADIIWFTLFHELGHVLLHGKRQVFVEDGDQAREPASAVREAEADRYASDALIPEGKYRDFVFDGDYSERTVRQFAKSVKISPTIVVGRLQHDGHVHPAQLQELKFQYDIVDLAGTT